MVPTTAGTGSEVTRWASLWDEQGRKFNADKTCKWAKPPKAPLYHLGGKHYTESKALAAKFGVTEPGGAA